MVKNQVSQEFIKRDADIRVQKQCKGTLYKNDYLDKPVKMTVKMTFMMKLQTYLNIYVSSWRDKGVMK